MRTTTYVTPEIVRLGTIHELTLQHYNKIGQSTDVYTALTGGNVVGSLVPTS